MNGVRYYGGLGWGGEGRITWRSRRRRLYQRGLNERVASRLALLAFDTARKEREPKKSRNIIVALKVTLLCPISFVSFVLYGKGCVQSQRGRFACVINPCAPSYPKQSMCTLTVLSGLFLLCLLAGHFLPGVSTERRRHNCDCDRRRTFFSR